MSSSDPKDRRNTTHDTEVDISVGSDLSDHRNHNHQDLPADVDEEYGSLPETLQDFLSNVGVLAPKNPSVASIATAPSAAAEHEDLIFESSFDLTEERLKHVFQMFDTDDDGKISYESLKRGLQVHTAAESYSLDDTSFQQLVEHLDVDRSGDITYEEFTDGMRLLMLRRLVLSSSSSSSISSSGNVQHPRQEPVLVQVMDYDANRLERYRVNANTTTTTATTTKTSTNNGMTQEPQQQQQQQQNDFVTKERHASLQSTMRTATPTTIHEMGIADFYFKDRPKWVKTRWINVLGGSFEAKETTLKQLAVKYMLHPLALEDALSSEQHRPKAEVYSSHYFIMVPIFIMEPLSTNNAETTKNFSGRSSSLWSSLNPSSWSSRRQQQQRFQSRFSSSTKHRECDDSSGYMDSEYHRTRVGNIRIQMTSIFVNVPTNDTIITYNDDGDDDNKNNNSNNHRNPIQNPLSPIGVGTAETNCWLRVQKELEKSYSKLRQYDAQYLVYALLDRAVDRIEPIAKCIKHELQYEKRFLHDTNFQNLSRVHELKEELEKIARKLKPFIRLLFHVIEDESITPGATVYLRDVLDNLECHDDEIKDLILYCETIDNEAEKFQSKKMDQTLYTLTVISAIFLPAQFLTGVWGMNFEHMPELDEKWGYAMFWGLAAIMSTTLLCLLDCGRLRD